MSGGTLGMPWNIKCFISDTQEKSSALDPCQPHQPAQLAHSAALVFPSHFLTFPMHSSSGHSPQGKLPDHEIALPFFLSFSCCSDTNLPVLSKSYSDLPCHHQHPSWTSAQSHIPFALALSQQNVTACLQKALQLKGCGKNLPIQWRIYRTIFTAR